MNIYYDPKEAKLEILGQLDESDLYYEYNTFVVWRDTVSNKLFYAHDSGCSCPTPFEEYHFRNESDHNLDEVCKSNLHNFENSVKEFPATVDEKTELLKKVRQHLKKK